MGVRRISKISMPASQSPAEAVQRLASDQILHPKSVYTEPKLTVASATERPEYKPPITVKELPTSWADTITAQLDAATEDYVSTVVQQIGVDIDKEELFRLLKGDRNSYEKGYQAGLMDGYLFSWKTMLVEHPADGQEVLVALLGEGNEVYQGVWHQWDDAFTVKASNLVIKSKDVLEWCPIPKRVILPF